MTTMSDPIALAREPAFGLGPLTVRPPTREVVGPGGTEVLEPRVMQVLVALHRAGGAIVARDDLTLSCWEGRVVGEDAINRVISRLRRTAEATGAFRIETVTKVGYRLIAADATPAPIQASAPDEAFAPSSRRGLLGAGLAAGAAAAAGGAWWLSRPASSASQAPPGVGPQMQQVVAALSRGGPEGNAQAIGLLRRIVAQHPDYADAWGTLALCYSTMAHIQSPREAGPTSARARAAAARALVLDPANPYARLAQAGLLPQLGSWRVVERVCREGLARDPDNVALLGALSSVLGSVGREAEAVVVLTHAGRLEPPNPGLAYSLIWSLWCSGQLEEADRAMDAAFQLFPLNYAVWFTRFYLLTYTGRAEQAIAMAERVEGRPLGIPASNFDLILLGARAVAGRASGDIEAAMRANLAAARLRAGQAENTVTLAAALGRLDEGFALLDAYFFGRGYTIGDLRFSPEQGTYTAQGDRHTFMLFNPPMAAMRADPRFARLTAELGLDRYWRETGTRPDYQRG